MRSRSRSRQHGKSRAPPGLPEAGCATELIERKKLAQHLWEGTGVMCTDHPPLKSPISGLDWTRLDWIGHTSVLRDFSFPALFSLCLVCARLRVYNEDAQLSR